MLNNRIVIFTVVFIVANVGQFTQAKKTEAQCIGEFEFWSCQSSTRQCQRICENKGLTNNRNNRLKCKMDCEKACVCEAGYLRDGPDGECVYESECPNFNLETGRHERVPGQKPAVTVKVTESTTSKPNIGKKLSSAKKNSTNNKAKPKRFVNTDPEYGFNDEHDEQDFDVDVINYEDNEDNGQFNEEQDF